MTSMTEPFLSQLSHHLEILEGTEEERFRDTIAWAKAKLGDKRFAFDRAREGPDVAAYFLDRLIEGRDTKNVLSLFPEELTVDSIMTRLDTVSNGSAHKRIRGIHNLMENDVARRVAAGSSVTCARLLEILRDDAIAMANVAFCEEEDSETMRKSAEADLERALDAVRMILKSGGSGNEHLLRELRTIAKHALEKTTTVYGCLRSAALSAIALNWALPRDARLELGFSSEMPSLLSREILESKPILKFALLYAHFSFLPMDPRRAEGEENGTGPRELHRAYVLLCAEHDRYFPRSSTEREDDPASDVNISTSTLFMYCEAMKSFAVRLSDAVVDFEGDLAGDAADVVSRASELAMGHTDSRISGCAGEAVKAALAAVRRHGGERGARSLLTLLDTNLAALRLADARVQKKRIYPLTELLLANLTTVQLSSRFEAILEATIESGFLHDSSDASNAASLVVTRLVARAVDARETPAPELRATLLPICVRVVAGTLRLRSSNPHAAEVMQRRVVADLLSHSRANHDTLARPLLRELSPSSSGVEEDDDDDRVWAKLCVLSAVMKGSGTVRVVDRTLPSINGDEADFTVDARFMHVALLHREEHVRSKALALLAAESRLVGRLPSDSVRYDLLRDALPLIIKTPQRSAGRDRLMESLLGFVARTAKTCGDPANDPSVLTHARNLMSWMVDFLASGLYPGSPTDRANNCLEVMLGLSRAFRHHSTTSETGTVVMHKLCSRGVVESVLRLLLSSFDRTRANALDFLSELPLEAEFPPLPATIKRFAPFWSALMRRHSDSGACFLRLVRRRDVVRRGEDVAIPFTPRLPDDYAFMERACELASRCVTVETAYDVGCVVVDSLTKQVVAEGFSRELPGNTHAEECALLKLHESPPSGSRSLTLYTTMEPCSLRLSGKAPCCARILAFNAERSPSHRVARVVVGVREPPAFVQNCTGVEELRNAGISVDFLPPEDEDLVRRCEELNADKSNGEIGRPAFDPERAFYNRMLSLLRRRVDSLRVEEVVEEAGGGLEEAAREMEKASACLLPNHRLIHRGEVTHGVLTCMRYFLKDENDIAMTAAWKCAFYARVYEETMRALAAAMKILGVDDDSRPDSDYNEALAMVNDDVESEEEEEEDLDGETRGDDDNAARLTTLTTWLLAREGSELLGELISSRWFPSNLANEGYSWLLASLLRLRHLGAVAHVASALERATHAFLVSGVGELERLPHAAVASLLDKLERKGFDKSLRRSEGFALSFRALVRAQLRIVRFEPCPLADACMEGCLAVLRRGDSLSRIHALNVLRTLFADSSLARYERFAVFAAQTLVESLNAFRDADWGVRNAALNAFSVVVRRGAGDFDNSWRREIGASSPAAAVSKHGLTASTFFALYPGVREFLLKQLVVENENHEGGKVRDTTALHAILSLLGSFRRAASYGMSELESHEESEMVELVDAVANVGLSSPDFLTRSAAAGVLASLTPPHAARARMTATLARAEESPNASHGAALQLLCFYREDRHGVAEDGSPARAFLLSLASSSAAPFPAREAALRLYEERVRREPALDLELFALVETVLGECAKVGSFHAGVGRLAARCARVCVAVMERKIENEVEVEEFIGRCMESGAGFAFNFALCEAILEGETGDDEARRFRWGIRLWKSLVGETRELVVVPLTGAYGDALLTAVYRLVRNHIRAAAGDEASEVARREELRAGMGAAKRLEEILVSPRSGTRLKAAALRLFSLLPPEENPSLFASSLELAVAPGAALESRAACAEAVVNVATLRSASFRTRVVLCCLNLLQDDDGEVRREAAEGARLALGVGAKVCEALALRSAFASAFVECGGDVNFREEILRSYVFPEQEDEGESAVGSKLYESDAHNVTMERAVGCELACRAMRRIIIMRGHTLAEEPWWVAIRERVRREWSSAVVVGELPGGLEMTSPHFLRLFCAMRAYVDLCDGELAMSSTDSLPISLRRMLQLSKMNEEGDETARGVFM